MFCIDTSDAFSFDGRRSWKYILYSRLFKKPYSTSEIQTNRATQKELMGN